MTTVVEGRRRLPGSRTMSSLPPFDDPGAWDWPLPPEPHRPGRNRRPSDDDSMHRIARAAPSSTVPDQWRSNPAYVAGLRLYAPGFYWEAHEVWEPVWMGAAHNSRERTLVQGMIQLANACLKMRMGQAAAAARLSLIAAGHIREATYGPERVVMGIDARTLLEAVEAFGRGLLLGQANIPVLPLAAP